MSVDLQQCPIGEGSTGQAAGKGAMVRVVMA